MDAKGFSVIQSLVAIGAIGLLVSANLSLLMFEQRTLGGNNFTLAANTIQRNVIELLSNEQVIENIFNITNLSNGQVVNGSASENKSLLCIKNHKVGPKNQNCANKKIPDNVVDSCSTFYSPEGKKYCWIEANLADSKVTRLPKIDPQEAVLGKFLIDNLTQNAGLDSRFSLCTGFSSTSTENFVQCPFRVDLYMWVECDDGSAVCGANGVNGQIKMAALFKVNENAAKLDFAKKSIIDIPVGRLF